jgi:flagellar assembly factor FliW
VLCLALLFPSGGTVEANLDAPVVINLHNSRCLQALSPDAGERLLQAERRRYLGERVC